jgi:hypothetical protein
MINAIKDLKKYNLYRRYAESADRAICTYLCLLFTKGPYSNVDYLSQCALLSKMNFDLQELKELIMNFWRCEETHV